ncbi:caspase family protein [Thioflexithrix psekupsensis]|uniref:Peptidase C14 caspase domain-containing protein n=1 Tax=Thioflexithrix psekupsensis TaxID=1570016 RepID=A0A251X3Y4_9GAMM|nr:caspase family protein [Thioflexithrix psekupsensis]OUD12100.1 hypothetical protein TPSD3_13310 [Thioflexithrix psekupsensis]
MSNSRLIYLLFFTFMLCCFGQISTTHAANLYSFIMLDTDDRDIGADRDLISIDTWLTKISRNTGLIEKRHILKIEGDMVSEQKGLEQAKALLENSGHGPGDVVIFYYSGHGLSSETSEKWPRLAMGGKTTKSQNFLEVEYVREVLSKKNPQLLLILVDACNNSALPIFPSLTKDLLSNPELPESYKKLFLGYEGILIASSSKKGEVSYGTQVSGGVFTRAFADQLRKQLISTSPSWEAIATALDGKPLTPGGAFTDTKQHPQFDISKLKAKNGVLIHSPAQPVVSPLPSVVSPPPSRLLCKDGPKAYFKKEGRKCCFISHSNEEIMCY